MRSGAFARATRRHQNDLMGELVLCFETLLRDPRLDVALPQSRRLWRHHQRLHDLLVLLGRGARAHTDPATGRLLGNFPQPYTHVGLIHAVTTIGELLDAREGRVRAWT